MTTRALTLDHKEGIQNPCRPWKGETQTFTAETNGLIIDKRGYGLVGVNHGAFATAATITFKVGLEPDLSDGQIHASVSFDATVAEANSTSDLAEWPYIQPILNAADSGDLGIALS